jgi:hypothetical protein
MRRAFATVLVVIAAGAILATAAAGNTPKQFFGMNLGAIPSPAEAKKMARGGVDTARFPFDWRAIQPHRHGGYNWHVSDLVVEILASAKVDVLPILYGSPPWVHKDPRQPPIAPASARRAWTKMIKATVNRYGPNGKFWSEHPGLPYRAIRHWQVWNEPNIPGYFAPKASPARYTKLLKITAKAIRSASAGSKVVLAGITKGAHGGGQMPYAKFLNGLYRNGAKRWFDVLALHPFAPDLQGVKSQIRKFRGVARKHGDGHKPLWLDEVGWATGNKRTNPLSAGSKRNQARLLKKEFHFVLKNRRRLGIGFLEWVLWRDRVNYAGCLLCEAGVETKHGRAKPAWNAYKKIATP